MNIEPAIYFVTERESIRKRREAGESAPWTDDSIFQQFSFCNAARERDRVTKHIARGWREPHKDDPHLWFAMAVARYINCPDTLDELGYPVPWDRDHFKRVLTARMQRGEQVFGAAYVIPNGGSSKAKIDYIADDVLNRLWRSREHMSPQPGTTLAAYCARLMDFDGVGSFMSGQVVADLRFVEPLLSASDRQSFAISGPGSRQGLNRLIGRPAKTPFPEPAWQSAFRRFEADIRPELQRVGLGDLHCQDLQNVLCETDKYLRTKLGEGTPKRRFAGGVARKIAA
jgi:hypothetical protein